MAEGGPGPSTMASSPVVPGSGSKPRTKRRVVNLVNPADPVEFSGQSFSMDMSVDKENIPLAINPKEREETPSPRAPTLPYTPLGVNKDGVRGILRQTGTPGSGNGVRFFPKNKFRIITPNSSLNPPPTVEATPMPISTPQPPASSRNGSFLSQLLAVTLPAMSPRKPQATAPTVEPVEPEEPSEAVSGPASADESWEVPGQEGEVSLVASSVASERSIISEGEEAETWTGTPEIHSSPLGLPTAMSETSLDNSQQLELPSREIQMPADMSNLMLQRLDGPSGMDSFSISDFSRTNAGSSPPPFELGVSTVKEESSDLFESRSRYSAADMSGMTSFSSVADRTDDNPTIRRPLSPLPAPASPTLTDPHTPPPAKAFGSIFADMSAEQAGLSWPLSAHASPHSEAGDETAFHSAILPDISTPSPSTMPQDIIRSGPTRSTPGNITQYFDCDSPSPMMIAPASLSANKTNLPSSSFSIPNAITLVKPVKALFEAHSAHTSALGTELDLYRNLATRLQAEVTERDDLLAKLNLRAIEGEVWRVRVDELEKKLREMKTAQQSPVRSQSLSPTPLRKSSQSQHVGDRTTVDQAAARDGEIRLAKALADQEAMSKQIIELQNQLDLHHTEITQANATIVQMEERERDITMQNRKNEDELRNQLESVIRRERSLHAQLDEARSTFDKAEEAKRRTEMLEERIAEQETEIRQLQDLRKDDEREIGHLTSEVQDLMARVHGEDDLITKLAEAETRVGEEKYIRKQVEKEMKGLKREKSERDREVEELKQILESTKAQLLSRLDTPASAPAGDVVRLRAESASKDLEILNLQKRKNELKEDLEMLNIALDSKQQELELMKRRFSVRGVAGSTPLAPSRTLNATTPAVGSELETPAPGRNVSTRRRSSAAFITPSMGSIRANGKMLSGGYGTEAWKSAMARKTLGKMEEENQPPQGEMGRGSVRRSERRERVLA